MNAILIPHSNYRVLKFTALFLKDRFFYVFFFRFKIDSASHIATVHIMFTELNRKLILTRECANLISEVQCIQLLGNRLICFRKSLLSLGYSLLHLIFISNYGCFVSTKRRSCHNRSESVYLFLLASILLHCVALSFRSSCYLNASIGK